MTSKVTTKIWWRAATGGPLAWALRWCDEREEASKDQDDEEQANLGREVSWVDWVDWVNQGQSLQFRNGKPDLRSKSMLTHLHKWGNHDVFAVFFYVFRPEMSRKTFFPLKFQTQNPMRKRKATLGIESGPEKHMEKRPSFGNSLLYRRVMTALGTWNFSWLEKISTKLPCRWSQWWRRRARPEERIERISRINIESPTDTPAGSVSCSSSEGCR